MSKRGDRLARQLRRHVKRHSTELTYNGRTYAVMAEMQAGAKVGVQNLPDDALGAYIASADPRVFVFSALDFQPHTEAMPPKEGDEFIWHGLAYLVTNTTYEDFAGDTVQVYCYAFRRVV